MVYVVHSQAVIVLLFSTEFLVLLLQLIFFHGLIEQLVVIQQIFF